MFSLTAFAAFVFEGDYTYARITQKDFAWSDPKFAVH
jgi:hypothetical protein